MNEDIVRNPAIFIPGPGEEVFYWGSDPVVITKEHVGILKDLALETRRHRARICAHPDTADALHEMLIYHPRGAYVRPHQHPGKSESFHVIEGEADVVLFDDEGKVKEVIEMGPFGSGKCLFYRLNRSAYHTLVIQSDHFVFHETTNGPFRREDTVFAPWAPAEDDAESVEQFMRENSFHRGIHP
jgi:cupin fold WbuC family metalloprotein